MRPLPRRVDPLSRRDPGLRQAGLEGARALTRLLVALIENLGLPDGEGRRAEGTWPHGRNLSAFGPSPLGVEIERAARTPVSPSRWQDSVTGLPIHEDAWDETTPLPVAPPSRPVPSTPESDPQAETRHAPAPAGVDVPPPPAAAAIPTWMRPFVPLPGVRYVRTPDHILRRRFAPEQPVPPIEREPDASDESTSRETLEPALSCADESDTPFEADGSELENIPMEDAPEAALLTRTAPQRLRLLSGVPVDLPDVANDTPVPSPAPAPTSRADGPNAEKSTFAVAVRAKRKPTAAAMTEAPANLARTPSRTKAAKSAWAFPAVGLLGEPQTPEGAALTADTLEQNARLLETTLEDFGVRGEIIHVRAGPVVTLYELEPAPGTKSSRVIGLADDIARSMSAVSARVAVVPGRNAIGIELPNERRETVFFREMVESEAFADTKLKLAIALGKTIGGEPVVAELAKMPHLLVAGTTGSGKSVAINTMILSLLYRLKPEQCRLIMVDPKMLELSIYDGIPHLLTPVVTDPKKAVVALKWAVREMEDRYRKMSKVGVRNIDGFNARIAQAKSSGETIVVPVTTGYDRETGKPVIEDQPLDLAPLPYIVVIVDEMADLMMVAGKDIEGAIQRLAQMARAAGIHLIMATQRPSVDVITGTIKANFPTRISFQVTSKIDSRTILGEMGAEQLLGQGDMLHMQGGGRIYRVHGPFVSDEEVERVVAHLKSQGAPDYLDAVTDEIDADNPGDDTEASGDAVFDKTAMGTEEDGDLYEQAVKIVLRDKKSSVSYVQRRLSVGYNKAASLIERMEKEGVLGPASHTGKREILVQGRGRIISGVVTGADED